MIRSLVASVVTLRSPADTGRQGAPRHRDGGSTDEAESPSGDSDGVVLVVDDDEEFAETVALYLDTTWDVRLAHDGDEAVEAFGPHVDVVLLDRRMPTMSGDEALPELREQDGEARIAMMTAVDPDLDIADMDFDMYLTKPIGRDELLGAVDDLQSRTTYARELQALFSLSSKLGVLNARYSMDELEDDERYQRLQTEFARLHEQSHDELRSLNPKEFEELLQVIDESP